MNNNLPNPIPCKCNGDGQIVKKFLKDQSNLSWPRYIPGPVGPAGPAGPAATIDSILTANDGTQSVVAGADIPLGTKINSTGTSLSYTAPNTITFDEDGTYLINVSSSINNTAGSTGDLGMSMQINGASVPTASEYVATQTAAYSAELQHNYTATTGDVLTVENGSTVSNDYHDLTVSIIRLV